ncbi:DMT family transporter [Streptomyces xylophagus]|uniref:DMT family transporter n=1 Tax=Streptomyces xylophagus TaxID=285514 RepID=UPI001F48DD4E|nr:DMT family transporter [Streptomyces xylophagus]
MSANPPSRPNPPDSPPLSNSPDLSADSPARTRLNRSQMGAIAGLLVVTAIWGATFVVVKDATARLPVFDFLMWRFGIAAVLMAVLRPQALRRMDRGVAGRGAAIGLLLGLAYITQTMGLQTTSAAVSGFLTGLFVVFTPLLTCLLFRTRLRPLVWVAVVIAASGLALMTLNGVAFGSGALLTLLCAVCFALHIVALGRWSPGRDPYALTVIQMATVSAMCFVGALFQGPGLRSPGGRSEWTAVLITAVLASAFAYMVQTWAQAHVTPTQAAVVLTMEPVFAGISAVVFGGESLTMSTIAGGGLVVAAMYLIELSGTSSGEATPEEASVGTATTVPDAEARGPTAGVQ